MQQLSPQELQQWIVAGTSFQLIDVREEYEHTNYNIGGTLLPIGELMSHRTELVGDLPIVCYCEKGIRSVIALQRLEEAGVVPERLYNLTGGMKAWRAFESSNQA